MKNILAVLICLYSISLMGQDFMPAFNYQALVLNGQGQGSESVCDQPVVIGAQLYQGEVMIGSEEHDVMTDCFGIVDLQLGTQGMDLGAVDWASGPYYIKLVYSMGGGEEIIGMQMLNYVPYALYAPQSGDGISDVITDEEGNKVLVLNNGDEITLFSGFVYCWDLNGNGMRDPETEDINGDGSVDNEDCRGEMGSTGLACWDLNGNGTRDPDIEDVNGDGVVDVADCRGAAGESGPAGEEGEPGPQGDPGEAGPMGIACWDLNGNGVRDPASEDVNGDGMVNVQDCRGEEGMAGPEGAQGLQGPQGETGPRGPQGPAGPEGETGPRGEQGPAGPAGPNQLIAFGTFGRSGAKQHGTSNISASFARNAYSVSVNGKSLSSSNCTVQITPLGAYSTYNASFGGGSLNIDFPDPISGFCVSVYMVQ